MAGASEGLGLAFARELAVRGHGLVLIARRRRPLEEAAATLEREFGVPVVVHVADLGAADIEVRLTEWVAATPPQLVVYNAAYAPRGGLLGQTSTALMRVVDVNVRGPLLFARHVCGSMAAHGSGTLILMASLAGLQGSPRIAAYAASKAFNLVLAEGLWSELRDQGVIVHACCAGAIRTPGYANAAHSEAPGTLDAERVARAALDAAGRGPRSVPGWLNKLAELVVGRWLPRRMAVRVMAAATRGLAE